jgi:hypothetical protein
VQEPGHHVERGHGHEAQRFFHPTMLTRLAARAM